MKMRILVVVNALSAKEEDKILKLSRHFDSSHIDYRLDLLFVKSRVALRLLSASRRESASKIFSDNDSGECLARCAKKLNCDVSNQWIASGSLKQESKRLAKKLGSTIILVGEQEKQLFSKVFNHAKYTQVPRIHSVTAFVDLYFSQLSDPVAENMLHLA